MIRDKVVRNILNFLLLNTGIIGIIVELVFGKVLSTPIEAVIVFYSIPVIILTGLNIVEDF